MRSGDWRGIYVWDKIPLLRNYLEEGMYKEQCLTKISIMEIRNYQEKIYKNNWRKN